MYRSRGERMKGSDDGENAIKQTITSTGKDLPLS